MVPTTDDMILPPGPEDSRPARPNPLVPPPQGE
jgi:hypothetical protein